MLSVTDPFKVLAIIDVSEKVGLDVMSAGVALAWATEATEKGIISEKETLVHLSFGDSEAYKQAMEHLGRGTNDFYRLLAGRERSERPGITAERILPAFSARKWRDTRRERSFLPRRPWGCATRTLTAAVIPMTRKRRAATCPKAVEFLVKDEQGRVLLTSMVACLFARGVYTDELLARCLKSVGYDYLADNLGPVSRNIQELRWKMRLGTGFMPEDVTIPKRFYEIETFKGALNADFLGALMREYSKAIRELSARQG